MTTDSRRRRTRTLRITLDVEDWAMLDNAAHARNATLEAHLAHCALNDAGKYHALDNRCGCNRCTSAVDTIAASV